MAAAISVFALQLLIRRSIVAAVLILLVFLVEAVYIDSIQVLTAPVTLYADDVLFVLVAAAAVARLLRVERLSTPQLLLVILSVLALVSLGRGLFEFAPQESANEFRKFFKFASTALFFSTVEPVRDIYDRLAVAWLVTAAALLALLGVRWVANAGGLTGGIYGDGGLRALPASDALFLLQALLIALPALRRDGPAWVRRLAPLLFVAVILLQHRTVWVAAIVGSAIYLVRRRDLSGRFAVLLVAAAVVGGVVSGLVFDEYESPVTAELSESATNPATFEWRYEGWVALLRDSGPEGLRETLVGLPFGTGWDRAVSGELVTVSPHSHYLETYLRTGALGVLTFLLLLGYLVTRLRAPPRDTIRARPRDTTGLLSHDVLLAIVLTQAVFAVPYSLLTVQGILFGLALSTTTAQAPIPHSLTSHSPVRQET